jgi:hypothetical protein
MEHHKLEDVIMRFYNVKEYVTLLIEKYIDRPAPMTEDEMWNHLAALETMVDLYIDAGMDTYCRVYELNQYAPEEIKALREKLFGSKEVQKAIKKTKKAK